MVRLNENGSLAYAGRSDKYFANNEGRHFDAGIVEVQMSAHPAVNMCAVVPVLEKRIHDTVPVLYVVPAGRGSEAELAESIRRAFVSVYIENGKISDDNLPVQFVLVSSIPCNSNGKIDVFRITRERLDGRAYNLYPVREDGKLKDIRIELAEQLSSITGGAVPEGMDGNSAFNLFDLLNASPVQTAQAGQSFGPEKWVANPFWAAGMQLPNLPPQLMENLEKGALKFFGKLYHAENITRDLDE